MWCSLSLILFLNQLYKRKSGCLIALDKNVLYERYSCKVSFIRWVQVFISDNYFQVALVYGQMNEPPGARARVALTGLTVAEYFRDVEGQDVLLFIDNIFRFTQAGSEVSALLGRIPSAVGYQPTLATDMGCMQERITTTRKGSITSVQV